MKSPLFLDIKAPTSQTGKGGGNPNLGRCFPWQEFGLGRNLEQDRKMKLPVGVLILAVTALAGCAGPEGNPNGFPYASEPGGGIATQPQTIGTVSYDPYAPPAPFADMQAGQPAINPPPLIPMNPPPPAR
jgi:hypothetical protein